MPVPYIKTPPSPKPSGDVIGPNSPDTIEPHLDDPFRDPGGDVGLPGRVAGRKPVVKRDRYGFPIGE